MSDAVGVSTDTNEPSRGAVAVAAAACIAIAGMLSWRALVGQPPSLWFDVTPHLIHFHSQASRLPRV